MNLLLDTHALLWLLLKDKRLPRETALTIIDRSNTVFVSSISGFEIATKVSIGKLPDAEWIELDGVGHCPQLNAPGEVARLVREHVAGVERV